MMGDPPDDEDDPVLEAGLESYPASDPPAWSTKARRLEAEKARSAQKPAANAQPESAASLSSQVSARH